MVGLFTRSKLSFSVLIRPGGSCQGSLPSQASFIDTRTRTRIRCEELTNKDKWLFCSCQYQWLKSKQTFFEEEPHSGRLPPCLRTLLLWSRPHPRHLDPYLLLLIHLFPGNQCFPHLLIIFPSSAPQLFHHPQWQHHRETSQRRGRHCRQHLQQGRSTEYSQREKRTFQEKWLQML